MRIESRQQLIECREQFKKALECQYKQVVICGGSGCVAGGSLNVYDRMKQLMEERGWTDYRLAKEANLSHSTITNVFKRNNAPTLPTLEVICRAFGITLAQFFAEGGEAVEITDEQRELFAKWSTLTEKQKALLLEFISTLQ